jgi:hypothetical protein
MLEAKFCNSPLGKLINNALKPVSLFTGGILGNCCPEDKAPSLAEQAKPGAEGLAARIMAEEANAKARRAAARFLGTVDCHVFPGVDKALVDLLRKDTNECVRLEAALALGRGCCCNKVTIQGLALTVSGSEKDGSRQERSERVRQAAAASLAHCLGCVGTAAPQSEALPKPSPEPPTKGGEKPTTGGEKPGDLSKLNLESIQLSAYYKRVEQMSMSDVIAEGRKALDDYQTSTDHGVPQRQGRSLTEVLASAFGGSKAAPQSDAGESNGQPTVVAETGPIAPIPASPPPVAPAGTLLMPTRGALVTPPAPVETQRVQPAVQPVKAPVVPAASQPVVVPARAPVVSPVSKPAPAVVVPQAAAPATPKQVAQGKVAPSVVVQAAKVKAPAPTAVQVQATGSAGVVSGVTNVPQMVLVLRESIYPEQREWAAERLSTVNWQSQPQIPAALLRAAQEDTSPAVQVACIRGLVRMRYTGQDLYPVLTTLRNSTDLRVRTEAGEALVKTGGATSPTVLPATYIPSRSR